MKKILGFILLIFTMTSCYDDYVKDYTYNAVYFAYQYDVRTFVVGEGMQFDFGVGLGGTMTNSKQRVVTYSIDTTLITPAALAAMKASSTTYIKSEMTPVGAISLLNPGYYSLTNGSKFIIEKGQDAGKVTIRPDSAAFLADPKSLIPNYVLPLRITSAGTDSILPLKRTIIIGIKYENMLFGNYWHGGQTIRFTAANVAKDTLKYFTAIPSAESKVWVLKTTAPFELTVNGYSGITGTKQELKLALNGTTISIGSAIASTFAYSASGDCVFNRAKLLQDRKIYLKYKYVDATGYTCYATDTLTFRNRIRDGVNEWQDENPSHY
jgi:hypothetical protein